MAFGRVGSRRNLRQGNSMGKVPEDKKICGGLSFHIDLLSCVSLCIFKITMFFFCHYVQLIFVFRHDI